MIRVEEADDRRAASQADDKVVPVVPNSREDRVRARGRVWPRRVVLGSDGGGKRSGRIGNRLGVGLSNQTAMVPGGTNTIDSVLMKSVAKTKQRGKGR